MATHDICDACWWQRNNIAPVRMKGIRNARCCFCKLDTADGVFIKSDEPIDCGH